ncbi:type VI secretion system ImpA family N-terminal domain-containing protein [Photobacterium nomapromontoriensis]|uniref:type VI secretion system ImpA family N-terminal domain-containing protein n=1 Tax=Photobacterium nomapromontoriensis TaxID=2910237 RepID=UPI003D0CCFD8
MFFSDFTRRPIDETNPCGMSPNGLDDFDEIKRQINNLNKVTGNVSWKIIQTLSKKILSSHGKDFRCSCYYTVAATHNDGLKGLVEGLNSLLDLCVVYWYSAYPEHSKANARMSAIEWMVEYTEKHIKKHKALPEEQPLIEAAHQLCLKIEGELRLYYGIKAPSLGRIRRVLNQWTEEQKELDQQIKNIPHEKKTKPMLGTPPSQPAITVDITTPSAMLKSTSAVNPKHQEPVAKKSSKMVIYSMVGLLILAFTSFFIYKQQQYHSLKEQIETASLPSLKLIFDSISSNNESHIDSLRTSMIERLDVLMTDWNLDPEKVSNIDALDKLTYNLTEIYPDSSSALQLRKNFLDQRSHFESEYNSIYNRFTNARTVFANVATQNFGKDSTKAYEYSNSLFPLLGRIEYVEKHTQQKEIDRALFLLNTYLYKLNQLQTTTTNNK